jgi:UDP-4-amino-4,6-dideoxy-N-acetyl-beta-L-altrosamine N-acetyltransferase
MSENAGVVSLRPLELGDITRILEWRNLPGVAGYMYTDHRISESEHARWFAGAMTDDTKRYWIIELDGAPVGVANLYDISAPHKRASLALYLADERVRGLGVGAATDRFLIRFAFEDLGLEKLCAEVIATNEPGVEVHRHRGFQVDGVLRRHVIKAGRRVDVVTLSLLREDWTADASVAAVDAASDLDSLGGMPQ